MRAIASALLVAGAGCDLVFPPASIERDAPTGGEIDANDDGAPPDAATVSPCDPGGQFDPRRYQNAWNVETDMQWGRGRQLCADRGWELVTIDTPTEATALGALFTTSAAFWVGLVDDGGDHWRSLHGCPDPLAWQGGQPDGGAGEDCAALVDDALHDVPCVVPVGGGPDDMICEQPRPTTAACVADAAQDPFAITYDKLPTPMSWDDARLACEALGAHLAVFDTPSEHARAIAQYPADHWIGATDAAVEGEWVSATGCPGFLPWSVDEPSNTGGVEDCAMTVGVGLNDTDCSDLRIGLCEFPP